MKHTFINSLTPTHLKCMEQQIDELTLAKKNLESQLSALRTENATLKRRLDEAMKGLKFYADSDNWKRNGPCDPNSGNFDAITHALDRITEIDKL